MDEDITYYLVFRFTNQGLIKDSHFIVIILNPQICSLFSHRNKQEPPPQMFGSHIMNLLFFHFRLFCSSPQSLSFHTQDIPPAQHASSLTGTSHSSVVRRSFRSSRLFRLGLGQYLLQLFTHLFLQVLFADSVQWLLHSKTGCLSSQIWFGNFKNFCFPCYMEAFFSLSPTYKAFIIAVLNP